MKASKNFVRIYVGCTNDSKPYAELMKRCEAKGYPETAFLDGRGELVEHLTGVRDVEAFRTTMAKLALRALPHLRLRESIGGTGEFRPLLEERVRQLGDADPEVRQKATAELSQMLTGLEAALEMAAKSGDAEVRSRALDIIKNTE